MTAFDNIKRIAKKRGMSLQTVAEKAGLSRNLIYQYNGKPSQLSRLFARLPMSFQSMSKIWLLQAKANQTKSLRIKFKACQLTKLLVPLCPLMVSR